MKYNEILTSKGAPVRLRKRTRLDKPASGHGRTSLRVMRKRLNATQDAMRRLDKLTAGRNR